MKWRGRRLSLKCDIRKKKGRAESGIKCRRCLSVDLLGVGVEVTSQQTEGQVHNIGRAQNPVWREESGTAVFAGPGPKK